MSKEHSKYREQLVLRNKLYVYVPKTKRHSFDSTFLDLIAAFDPDNHSYILDTFCYTTLSSLLAYINYIMYFDHISTITPVLPTLPPNA
jgi:hypothetical protein